MVDPRRPDLAPARNRARQPAGINPSCRRSGPTAPAIFAVAFLACPTARRTTRNRIPLAGRQSRAVFLPVRPRTRASVRAFDRELDLCLSQAFVQPGLKLFQSGQLLLDDLAGIEVRGVRRRRIVPRGGSGGRIETSPQIVDLLLLRLDEGVCRQNDLFELQSLFGPRFVGLGLLLLFAGERGQQAAFLCFPVERAGICDGRRGRRPPDWFVPGWRVAVSARECH